MSSPRIDHILMEWFEKANMECGVDLVPLGKLQPLCHVPDYLLHLEWTIVPLHQGPVHFGTPDLLPDLGCELQHDLVPDAEG